MKKKSSREIIVTTAVRLFYQQGYGNTGINQIIEEAEVSKASLYQHFPSKEDLLVVYLQVTGEQTIHALRAAAANYTDPMAKLMAIFDHLEGLVQEEGYNGCSFLNMAFEMPEGARWIREHVRLQRDKVRALFEEILSPLEKDGLGDEVYTVFEGALITQKVHRSLWPVTQARNIVRKIIY